MTASFSEKTEKTAQALLVAFFLCVITLPGLGYICSPSKEDSVYEKRRLRQMPHLHMDYWSVKEFPWIFEGCFNDHIGLRNSMIRLHNRLKISVLHDQQLKAVVIGKDGWMFYDGAVKNDHEPMADYRGLPTSRSIVLQWRNMMEKRAAWLAARNIRYVLVSAPNKQLVYAQYMPENLTRIGLLSPTDQVLARLSDMPNLYIVDLRPLFKAVANGPRIYPQTDTHWNQRGAFLAYKTVMDIVSSWFPSAAPHPVTDFDVRCEDAPGGDLAAFLALPDHFIERSNPVFVPRFTPAATRIPHTPPELQIWTTANPALPRAVVFRDSSADNMIPFLSEHFERIIYSDATTGLDKDLIERERPDVVMTIMAERSFRTPP
jgi:alginate O-acetyltransferase complex protein AlgJ